MGRGHVPATSAGCDPVPSHLSEAFALKHPGRGRFCRANVSLLEHTFPSLYSPTVIKDSVLALTAAPLVMGKALRWLNPFQSARLGWNAHIFAAGSVLFNPLYSEPQLP